MLTQQENELFTRVDRGSLGGELLRRYWWPVDFSEQVRQNPRRVRLLGEDFVLFRKPNEDLGLLDLQCTHRGASLEYGRVEAAGLRCAYHGWQYDVDGRCVDQPAEPEGSTFKDKVCQHAYHVREAGGLVFAYIGPEPVPQFLNLDIFRRRSGTRYVRSTPEFANWFQFAENLADPAHLPILHASGYPEIAMKRVELDYEPNAHGMRMVMRVPDVDRTYVQWFLFPAGIWVTTARVTDPVGPSHNMFVHTPIDNENTCIYHMQFVPAAGGDEVVVTEGKGQLGRGEYVRVDDGWWGIDSYQEDRIVQESQGVVADRTQEHLATSDRGIVVFRNMMREAIAAVREGRDPVNVSREPRADFVLLDASMPQIGVLA